MKDEDKDEDEKEACRRTNSCDTNSANVVVNCTSLMTFLHSLGIIDILDISFVFVWYFLMIKMAFVCLDYIRNVRLR